ncbi:MAG: hypothetical protein NTW28_03610, partial [Candidatus Solibacter sp.]|nr:hypothetical protein [Candidatus Solibacter sp.]
MSPRPEGPRAGGGSSEAWERDAGAGGGEPGTAPLPRPDHDGVADAPAALREDTSLPVLAAQSAPAGAAGEAAHRVEAEGAVSVAAA